MDKHQVFLFETVNKAKKKKKKKTLYVQEL